jgi:hypothetical protein
LAYLLLGALAIVNVDIDPTPGDKVPSLVADHPPPESGTSDILHPTGRRRASVCRGFLDFLDALTPFFELFTSPGVKPSISISRKLGPEKDRCNREIAP